MGCQLH